MGCPQDNTVAYQNLAEAIGVYRRDFLRPLALNCRCMIGEENPVLTKALTAIVSIPKDLVDDACFPLDLSPAAFEAAASRSADRMERRRAFVRLGTAALVDRVAEAPDDREAAEVLADRLYAHGSPVAHRGVIYWGNWDREEGAELMSCPGPLDSAEAVDGRPQAEQAEGSWHDRSPLL
jgi:hypothetical protein